MLPTFKPATLFCSPKPKHRQERACREARPHATVAEVNGSDSGITRSLQIPEELVNVNQYSIFKTMCSLLTDHERLCERGFVH
ncbi:hypothetical protein CY34DRAFT_807939 [Suillus luteus UH-Slu-Lm8-n1]|uniref:Uncharacterized protein n=1 Tax=Suillus luteus UH-Slu-Lm8-n1 TaxID=930992 RepID=A0A0D0AZJ7_9AGAM|nr:hypothetical protein CY34DRAFT_807939 [Suillus luteus UH-Slu-Lm8-n1]